MRTFARFVVVGLANTVIGFGIIFFFMLVVGLSPIASNLIGYSLGLCISFACHKKFTFKSDAGASAEFLRFIPVFLVCYLLNLVTLHACIDYLNVSPAWSQIIAGVAYIGSSFLLNRALVFTGKVAKL